LDGGQTWSSINQCSTNPNAKINSIDFSGTNPNIMYATVKGYINGQKVFKSTNGGQTWNNISSGLPNILMKEVLLAQNKYQEILYVATELGVYYKVGNNTWTKLGGNTLPNVIVNDIDINYAENALVAATFGRGLWQIDISAQLGFDNKLFKENQVQIYPNPITDDVFYIKFNDNNKYYNYHIYNIVGGLVKEGKLQNKINKINIESLPKGIYNIRIFDSLSEYTMKIYKYK
jgi:hypothetical protein